MKNISIKKKITIWFSMALFIILTIAILLSLAIAFHVFNRELKNDLINQVSINVEQIEHYNSIRGRELEQGDQFLSYNGGILEVDDDFCEYYNGIYTALIDENNVLLYGECPIRLSKDESFNFNEVTPYRYNDTNYYIYECPLNGTALSGLHVRGVASLSEGSAFLYSIVKFSWFTFPLLGILTVLGGYIITHSSFKPLEKIVRAADSINSGSDLSARIHLDEGNNELTRLADTFNRMFDRLEQAFKREQQFTSDVSHELRTPLAVVLSQCELTLEMAESEEDYREALEVIQLKSTQMNELISQLLFFSRTDSGRLTLKMSSVNLTDSIFDACKDFKSEKNITIQLDLDDDVKILGDSNLIRRVLINLINNGEEYGRENGFIKISLHTDVSSNHAVISVLDNGIGIENQHLDKIWNRFYQVDTSRSSNSAGLGLPMVKEIVELHSGNVSINSVYGEGSEFIIQLPLDYNA